MPVPPAFVWLILSHFFYLLPFRFSNYARKPQKLDGGWSYHKSISCEVIVREPSKSPGVFQWLDAQSALQSPHLLVRPAPKCPLFQTDEHLRLPPKDDMVITVTPAASNITGHYCNGSRALPEKILGWSALSFSLSSCLRRLVAF